MGHSTAAAQKFVFNTAVFLTHLSRRFFEVSTEVQIYKKTPKN
jgi:hypothetical protein